MAERKRKPPVDPPESDNPYFEAEPDTLPTAVHLAPATERLPRLVDHALVDELGGLTDAEVRRLTWLLECRPEQLAPPGEWLVWLIQAGRGWGKTRVGAEDSSDWLQSHPGGRLAIVAPTFSAGKSVCVEGESGLLAVLPEGFVEKWNRSEGLLVCANGAQAQVYSSEEPERLRGPQFHRAWVDELAAFKYLQETWDMLAFALRLPWQDDDGEHEPPRAIVTTTPKPLPLLRSLRARETTHITRGGTRDNAENLAPTVLEELERRYAGTSLGRQELDGELLDDAEGAMWTRGLVEAMRLRDVVPADLDLDEAVKLEVAVDPAVTFNDDSDETGIVVLATFQTCPCGKATEKEPHVLVLEDASGQYAVSGEDGWPTVIVDRYDAWQADRVVAEVNNGGDLVEAVVRSAAAARDHAAGALVYKSVVASRGKRPRAEPVVGLSEQGRVHLVGAFPKLEDQMCEWNGKPGSKSPDRLDALVWGVWSAVLGAGKRRGGLS